MLNAFDDPLCSILCWHNRRVSSSSNQTSGHIMLICCIISAHALTIINYVAAETCNIATLHTVTILTVIF